MFTESFYYIFTKILLYTNILLLIVTIILLPLYLKIKYTYMFDR